MLSFLNFLSLPTQQDCVLPVIRRFVFLDWLLHLTPVQSALKIYAVFRGKLSSNLSSNHREHTILLSRERVNKRTKRMTEQFNFFSCSHLFYLTRFYWENCCLQIPRNTVTLNSYLGLSALSKKFFWFV